ncbi:tudor domain-containing 6-like [Pholidichthys leucotaenia]
MCSIPGLPTPGSKVPFLITKVNLNSSYRLVELWVKMDGDKKHIYEPMREQIHSPERKFYDGEGKPGDLCLICIGDIWHRAQIVSILNGSYKVFLIDQGLPHTATNEDLAWGQSDSFFLPPEIESCILANILTLENKWSPKTKRFLTSLVGKRFNGLVQHILMPDRIILLEIPDISNLMCKFRIGKTIPLDEFKNLALKCMNLPKRDSLEWFNTTKEGNLRMRSQLANREHYFCPELLTDSLEMVNVTEVIDPLNIFCKLHIFSKPINILSEQIDRYYKENLDFGEEQPQTCGDPCAAKGEDGRWYRSLIKQNIRSRDDVVEVLHVDEGKVEGVPAGDIKPLFREFMRMPVVTYHCSLNGLKEDDRQWTAEETNYLKSLLLNQTMVASFDKRITQDVYFVTLYTPHATCINDCFKEKAGYTPRSEPEHNSNGHKEPIPTSFFSLPIDEQSMQLQSKVDKNQDGLPVETWARTKNKLLSDEKNYVSDSSSCDVQIKAGSEDPDPLIHHSEHFPVDFLSEVHACDDSVSMVGSGADVGVSCIESLKIWCRSTEKGESFKHLVQDHQNNYTSARTQPLVESICVARNPADNMWYRAKIIPSSTSFVQVRFIDYSHTQKVPLQDVHLVDPAFAQLNVQAFQCLFNLKGISNSTPNLTNGTLTEFEQFADPSDNGLNCVVKAVTSDEDSLPQKMSTKTASENACKILTQKCAEAYVQNPLQVMSDFYKCSTYDIEVGGKENIWITSSENVHNFYCQLNRNSHLFDKVMTNIAEIPDLPQTSDQSPELDSICLARYSDNQWYRGQVVETSPKLKVHFVDFGDTLALNETEVSPFPTEATVARTVPVLAIPLGLFNVPAEIPQEINQWFEDHAIGNSFTIAVVEKMDEGKLIVELFDGSLNVNVKVKERI